MSEHVHHRMRCHDNAHFCDGRHEYDPATAPEPACRTCLSREAVLEAADGLAEAGICVAVRKDAPEAFSETPDLVVVSRENLRRLDAALAAYSAARKGRG